MKRLSNGQSVEGTIVAIGAEVALVDVGAKGEATIAAADVDLVVIGTPIDLTRVIKIDKPSQRVRYELQEIGVPTLVDILKEKFGK